jgi:hypothetical protein
MIGYGVHNSIVRSKRHVRSVALAILVRGQLVDEWRKESLLRRLQLLDKRLQNPLQEKIALPILSCKKRHYEIIETPNTVECLNERTLRQSALGLPAT